jgi:hypothetical protein
MKLNRLLPPAVALVLVGTWVGVQRRSLAAVERENETLRHHISAARSNGPEADPSLARISKDAEPLDWKRYALEQSSAYSDMRVTMRFHRRLKAMTRQEILDTLDEIAKSDLSANARSTLEQTLVGQLAQLDPELVLTKFIDCLQDEQSGIKHQLPAAFEKWAKQEPQRAVAWLDRQIAEGKFASKSLDGANRFRILFEGGLVGVLLDSDPDSAVAALRLAALPEAGRTEVIDGHCLDTFKKENPVAFANLIRGQGSPRDQTRMIARQASQLVWSGSYAKVTEYLDLIEASPAERSVSVEQSAISRIQSFPEDRKITSEDIAALRDWVGSQAADTTDQVTGKFLGEAVRSESRLDFTEAAGLALQFSQAAGNDVALGAFLESWPVYNNHKEEVRVLAENIADENLRAQILKRLE